MTNETDNYLYNLSLLTHMFLKIVIKTNWDKLVAKEAMEAVEQITNEMGAEIHDDLMQRLTVFRFYFDRIEKEISNPSGLLSLLTEMKTEFEKVSQSVRRTSRQLMPIHIDQKTFTQRIQLLCLSMASPQTGHVHFENVGKELSVPSLTEIHLSRIVQELIHNAFKHSVAWHVWVRMVWDKKSLSIIVEDDGTAFAEVDEAIDSLSQKHNTLKLRTLAVNGKISYEKGIMGLLTEVTCPLA